VVIHTETVPQYLTKLSFGNENKTFANVFTMVIMIIGHEIVVKMH
jgi:hypothetical protein